jgi:hypothetical protein
MPRSNQMSETCPRSHLPNEETRQALVEAEAMSGNGTMSFATVEELIADLNDGAEDEAKKP